MTTSLDAALELFVAETGFGPGTDEFDDVEVGLHRPSPTVLTATQVVRIGVQLWQTPPEAIPYANRGAEHMFHLALAAAVAEIVPQHGCDHDDAADMAAEIRRRVTALVPCQAQERATGIQRAALRCVLQLGGARAVGLPDWIEPALSDTEHWTACSHLLDWVAAAVENTAPGRCWLEVPTAGVATVVTGPLTSD